MTGEPEASDDDSDEPGITGEDIERIRTYLRRPIHQRESDDLACSSEE